MFPQPRQPGPTGSPADTPNLALVAANCIMVPPGSKLWYNPRSRRSLPIQLRGVHMPCHRRALVASLPLLLVTIAAGAALVAFWRPLPDPEVANRDQLVRWIVTRDLAKERMETRQALARRVVDEFLQGSEDGPDWKAAAERLTDSQRQQLWDNLSLLLETWFLDQADGYCQLCEADRQDYVDRFIDSVSRCRDVNTLRPGAADTAAPSEPPAVVFLRLVEQWKQRAEPQQQNQISEFSLAVQRRWLERWIMSKLPGAGRSADQRGFRRGAEGASMSLRSPMCHNGKPRRTRSASTSNFC
jgi:hypothetical protein